MKKVLIGCLMTIVVLFGLLLIGGISLYIYLNLPNKIEFIKQPISFETINNKLDFNGDEVPEIVTNESKENILYQAILESFSGFDGTVVYKQINKTNREIKLEKRLPITQSDLQIIKNNGFLSELTSNPVFKIAENNKTPSGNSLIIYSKTDSLLFNLKKGYYSLSYYEIDKVGVFGEIIIYDKECQLLYITRTRYFAFQ